MDAQLEPSHAEHPSQALCLLLDELAAVLRTTSPDIYCARFASAVTGSIGEHVRHCLDHVTALLGATPDASLSYDSRTRGTRVETDPAAAVQQISTLRAALLLWPARSLEEPIAVAAQLTAAGTVLTTRSTLARELVFVTNHTIHHQAIIGVLLAAHGRGVPERFGHAPSTPTRH